MPWNSKATVARPTSTVLLPTYQNLADDVVAFMQTVDLEKADVFGYSMGAVTGLQLAIRHPERVNKLAVASVAYDFKGWQPAFREFKQQMTVEMFLAMPFAEDYKRLTPDPDGFPALVEKLIALEHEPMAWEEDVRALQTPVLIITGDADIATLEHSVSLFRLLGGGIMGIWGSPCRHRASPSSQRPRIRLLSRRWTSCTASLSRSFRARRRRAHSSNETHLFLDPDNASSGVTAPLWSLQFVSPLG